ncbi:3'-5' exonuclease family protein [Haloarcula amylovorans]|uniref:hypothetical protein n=1 Tax=Haloarcula amylovorans TaxID=2562280 RepID=UPI001076921B|nr:hypothetical protein [Halomicroarcula amylolytica]
MGTIALDIETISPHLDSGDDVDFLDSRDFRLLAIGVGYRETPHSDIETDVLWREETRSGDEYRLLCELGDWANQRIYDKILTFNGVNFDERHLRGRAAVLAEELGDMGVPDVVHHIWEGGHHRDLMHDITRSHGHRMSLDDAVEEHCGYRPASVSWDGETIENGDIPALGEDLLAYHTGLSDMSDERATHLRDVLETYVVEDIKPLFDLYDALSEDR